jgi:catechol 2,3-dioxygenase-like lactoylglutathione lyase family enzyme
VGPRRHLPEDGGRRHAGAATSRDLPAVPIRGIQHVDLAVADVDRSLAYYLDVLGPLGLSEQYRVATYRGTEEVVYLAFGAQALGLRPADGGAHRHYDVGIEHLAFEVETPEEVDGAYHRCVAAGGTIQSPPEPHYAEDADEGYYAFFAFDTDGLRMEVFCWPGSVFRQPESPFYHAP